MCEAAATVKFGQIRFLDRDRISWIKMMSIRRHTLNSIKSIVSKQQFDVKKAYCLPSISECDTIMNNFNFQSMSMSTNAPPRNKNQNSKEGNRGGSGGFQKRGGGGNFRGGQGERGGNDYRNGRGPGRGGERGGNSLFNRQLKNQKPKTNLRSHAVSVMDGDYTDHDLVDENFNMDDDEGFKTSSTLYSKFGEDGESMSKEKWDLINYHKLGDDEIDDDEREQRQREKDAYETQKAEDAKRTRWIENAKPPVRIQEIDSAGRSYGRGGRKTSSARVWIYPGEGVVTINRREFLDYFPRESDREMILSPFVATKTCGMFDMTVQVEGGGVT